MTYAEFSDNGYNYLDEYNNILFSADNTHNYLLDYVATNLSDLPEVFEQYITKRIDTSDFGLRKYKNSIEDINKLKEILISAHPYYKYEYKRTIIKAIGNYFNKLLLYSVFTQNTLPFDYTIKENWYIEKFHILIPSSLIVAGDYPNGLSPFDFYHKYKIWIGDRGYSVGEIEESLIPNVPPQMPIGFSEELLVQKNIRDLIFHTPSTSTQPLKDLANNDITSTKLPSSYKPKSLDAVGRGIYANMLDPYVSVIVRAKTISTTKIYEINNLQELLYLEIWNMIQSKTEIKKCENCGKYFIQKHKNQKYCNRIDEPGVSCAIAAKRKLKQDRLENNPALKLYDTAYKKYYARFKNGTINQQQFTSWQYKAKEKLKQVEDGKLDISCFQEWLK